MEIRYFVTRDGKAPFARWLTSLKDRAARTRILNRIDRLALGNFGDSRSVGHGVHEIRIHYGPGYRLYYGHTGKQVILLLCGGDKTTQQHDITRAIEFWRDYRSRS